MTDNQIIRNLLSVPFDERSYLWQKDFFDAVVNGHYEVLGSTTAANGRSYIGAMICSDEILSRISPEHRVPEDSQIPEDEVGVRNYASLNYYALERLSGIIFFQGDKENPEPIAELRFGSIWSYHQYLHLGGCPNCVALFEEALSIDEENPFLVKKAETGTVRMGGPSDEFFPTYVREFMTEELRQQYPACTPEFLLKEETDLLMSYSIYIVLGTNRTTEILNDLQQNLIWYMPPYLPIKM